MGGGGGGGGGETKMRLFASRCVRSRLPRKPFEPRAPVRIQLLKPLVMHLAITALHHQRKEVRVLLRGKLGTSAGRALEHAHTQPPRSASSFALRRQDDHAWRKCPRTARRLAATPTRQGQTAQARTAPERQAGACSRAQTSSSEVAPSHLAASLRIHALALCSRACTLPQVMDKWLKPVQSPQAPSAPAAAANGGFHNVVAPADGGSGEMTKLRATTPE